MTTPTTTAERPARIPAVTSRPPDLPSDHDVRELRLALVCYGGVSLAIYMHGITKELEKLTRASARLADSPDENPFPPDKSEHAYFNALKRKVEARRLPDAGRRGHHLRHLGRRDQRRLPREVDRTRRAAGRPARSLAHQGRDPEAALELAAAAAARRQPNAEVARRSVQRDGRTQSGVVACRRG